MAFTVSREIQLYRQAIALERVFPRTLRRYVRAIFFVATFAFFVASVLYVADASLKAKTFTVDVLITGDGQLFFGFFLMSFSLFFFLLMLTFFYNSRFYRGIESITHEGEFTDVRGISYEVAAVLDSGTSDITRALFMSKYGIEMLERCDISRDDILAFLHKKKSVVLADTLTLPERGFLTLELLADHIYEFDDEFNDFIFSKGVTEETWKGAVLWTMRTHHGRKHDTRWWSRDNLGKVAVIGKDWSYGGAYLLDEYARDIKTSAVFSVVAENVAYADEKVEEIESALSRSKDANIILVGEQGVGKMDIVMRLSQKMQSGDASPAIVGKHIVVFDTNNFIAQHNGKEELEKGLTALFGQAEQAGHIIIAIDNLPAFMESAHAVGVDAGSILDAYLASSELQFIVTSDPVQYQSSVEAAPHLSHRFAKVQIESPDQGSSIRVLETVATSYEKKYRIVFTYQAIEAIVEAAERYITSGVMPEKAVALLTEIAPRAARERVRKVTREYVNTFVSIKTGVPAGPVEADEREKLLNLESILHERVIGQNNAIKAISGVMRRARAGIQDADRPLGSFMFLGSTGVGKTETAKALAFVFFGAEEHMSRIDMSEYSGADALKRLIGNGRSSPGTLPLLLKEHPYGVLLLDEFEKASTEVHDLFLQIIDEGYFTAARGGKVSARNSIIIATSNAGANMIWELAKAHKDPSKSKDAIIDAIIQEKVYKPELLNRFDGIIIFEPLSLDDQEKIARIMLESLRDRIKKKGFELVIDEVLTNLLVRKGYDPEFGARPMRRVLQDIIEEKVAEKIIKGGLRPGDKIWFYDEDFVDKEDDKSV